MNGFSSSLYSDRVKDQKAWIQNKESFSRKLIKWLKILALTEETGN